MLARPSRAPARAGALARGPSAPDVRGPLLVALVLALLGGSARRVAAQPSLTVTTNALRTSATAAVADLDAGTLAMGSVTYSFTCPRRSTCTVYVHAGAQAATRLRVQHATTGAWADVGTIGTATVVDEQSAAGQARTFTGRVVAFAYPVQWSTAPASYVTPNVQLSVTAR